MLHLSKSVRKEMVAKTFWFTGLPASGKTTLAGLLTQHLRKERMAVEMLDGDGLRDILKTVGFSRDDRRRHVMSAAFTALLLNKHGVSVVASFVSPHRAARDEARALIGAGFVEIYLDCPVNVCIQRDPKGLYKKASRGEIKGMTGIDDPYESPVTPEISIKSGDEPIERSMEQLIAFVKSFR